MITYSDEKMAALDVPFGVRYKGYLSDNVWMKNLKINRKGNITVLHGWDDYKGTHRQSWTKRSLKSMKVHREI